MPANTPRGFPYPLPTEPVAEGAQAIRNLAEEIDARAMPVGAPIPWLLDAIPTGYIEFAGQTISAATYPKLYALFGATLPDLREKFLFGGGGATAIGVTGGAPSVLLTAGQSGIPGHAHHAKIVNAAISAGGTGVGANFGPSQAAPGDLVEYAGGTNAAEAHNNMPPFRAVRWITPAA